jgi:hypothetical protein
VELIIPLFKITLSKSFPAVKDLSAISNTPDTGGVWRFHINALKNGHSYGNPFG